MRRDVFQTLADPTRREIIKLIGKNTMTPGFVADRFLVSRQAISKHLKILTNCGLVAITRKGRERYCNLQPDQLNEVATWLNDFRKLWEDRFDQLNHFLLHMQTHSKHKKK